MNTTCEQISFITDEQKQDSRRNTLRLRERLMTEHGFETFDDREILTAVLSYAKGNRDTAGLVAWLFDHFGSLKTILEARPEQLLSVDGMTLSRASMISLVIPLTRVWHRCAMTVPDHIGNTREAEEYCLSLPEIPDSEQHLHGQMKTPSRRYENGVTAKNQRFHGPGNS